MFHLKQGSGNHSFAGKRHNSSKSYIIPNLCFYCGYNILPYGICVQTIALKVFDSVKYFCSTIYYQLFSKNAVICKCCTPSTDSFQNSSIVLPQTWGITAKQKIHVLQFVRYLICRLPVHKSSRPVSQL